MTKHNNRLKIAPTLMAKCVFTVLAVRNDIDMTWEELSPKQRYVLIDSVSSEGMNMIQMFGFLGELSPAEIAFIADKIVALLNKEPFDTRVYTAVHLHLSEAIQHATYHLKTTDPYYQPGEFLSSEDELIEGYLAPESKHEKLKAWYAGASPAERDELLEQLKPSDMDDEELQQYYDDILAQYDNPANHDKILLIQQALHDNPID